MQHGRRDDNHVAAGELARAHGFTTLDLGDTGDGCPDWCWGKHGLNFMVEMKRAASAPLQPKQKELAATWRGQWVRADSPEQAVELAEAYVAAFTRSQPAGAPWNTRPALTAAEARSMVERLAADSPRPRRPRRRRRRR